MKLCPKFLVLLFVIGGSYSWALGPKLPISITKTKYEVVKFRFAEHRSSDYERLVVEVKSSGTTAKTPSLSHKRLPKELQISLKDALFVGAIPEAQINDAYVKKSRFLGEMSINMDDVEKGVFLRVALKDAVESEAFWLTSPLRLVIDAYPKGSPRDVQGRNPSHASPRSLASHLTSQGSGLTQKEFVKNVVCFPEGAQLDLTISFKAKELSHYTEAKNAKRNQHGSNSLVTGKPICYHRQMEIVPNIGFHATSDNDEKEGIKKSSVLPPLKSQSQPWSDSSSPNNYSKILPHHNAHSPYGPAAPMPTPQSQLNQPMIPQSPFPQQQKPGPFYPQSSNNRLAPPMGPNVSSTNRFAPTPHPQQGPSVQPMGQKIGPPQFGQSSPLPYNPALNNGSRFPAATSAPRFAGGGPQRSLAAPPGVSNFGPNRIPQSSGPMNFNSNNKVPSWQPRPLGSQPGLNNPTSPPGFPSPASPGTSRFRPGGTAPGAFQPLNLPNPAGS